MCLLGLGCGACSPTGVEVEADGRSVGAVGPASGSPSATAPVTGEVVSGAKRLEAGAQVWLFSVVVLSSCAVVLSRHGGQVTPTSAWSAYGVIRRVPE